MLFFVSTRWREIINTDPIIKKHQLCNEATAKGYLSIVQWARFNNCPWGSGTSEQAAFSGHVDVFGWLRVNECPTNISLCIALAAKNGHIKILDCIYNYGIKMNSDVGDYAAKAGHIDTLEWAHEKKLITGVTACFNAAASGQLETLQWLRKKGYKWDISTCIYAHAGGYQEMIKWICDEGCPCNLH